MEDGLYVSAFIAPPGSKPKAGRQWVRHDQNIAAWMKTGNRVELLSVWELERHSGMKHHGRAFVDFSAFYSTLEDLLKVEGLNISDVRDIWGTPGLGSGAHNRTVASIANLPYHSYCHLLSAMLSDGVSFREGKVLGLAVDDTPDSVVQPKPAEWYAGGFSERGNLSLFSISSPAKMYSAASKRFGLEEGSLMALATASTSSLPSELAQDLGGLHIRGRYTPDGLDLDAELDRRIADLVSAAEAGHLSSHDSRFSDEENIASAVMKIVQRSCVDMMIRTIDGALTRFDADPAEVTLALSGGFALNCPANSALIDRFGFAGLQEIPSVSDCGQSIGIGLVQFYSELGSNMSFDFPGAYLGGRPGTIGDLKNRFGEFIGSVSQYSDEIAVSDMIEGPIVWVQGRSEVGPRALGHRSILADPRTEASRTALNELKRRQWWRPVAPIVLEERASEWFEDARPSPYMLQTFRIRDEVAAKIPAVAHLDASARIQTVSEEQDARIHGLISRFASVTGVPVVCNTSLNDNGEPIIERAEEALNYCLRKNLKVFYLDDYRIEVINHHGYDDADPLRRRGDLFI
ncbi:carbamoyltransferase C-terminal domain-containing protein [Mangrovactinospora gilvigrisea]|uniref:carbamoyltransferase C-terminal domain-containing protein n=1 Tax=Mangrovactinospora gilvigrisea TaxID=1428644 RepID=UPI0009A11A3E|nr:carbamoyltransferase C-terminal domain-containing protein [Mangrovactinospora gilvigrisea]